MESKVKQLLCETKDRSEFSQHGLLDGVAELLLISVAVKFYLLLFTLTTLPHSIISDARSNDTNASGNV